MRHELAEYGGGLVDKPEIIVLNKSDAMTPREISARRSALAKASGATVMVASGVSGQGVPEVLRTLQNIITEVAAKMTPSLATARRVVVKIGSALIVDPANRRPARRPGSQASPRTSPPWRRAGVQIIVVSSGAISLARQKLQPHRAQTPAWRKNRPPPPSARSASPRPGRTRSRAKNLTAAQLLITLEDTEDRRRYLNARATLSTLLGLGCIPVINENNSVATAEIRFGDNDRLAARVAEMVQADSPGPALGH